MHEDILGAAVIAQKDIWESRVAEVQKLPKELVGLTPMNTDQRDGRPLHYC